MMRVRAEDLPLPGLTLEVSEDYLLLESQAELLVVTSAPVGAEHRRLRRFLSVPAPRGVPCDDPLAVIGQTAARLGLEGAYAGFMTGVKLTNAVWSFEGDGGIAALCVTTVGVSNASRPGEARFEPGGPGTVNLLVVVDADLSEGALHETLALAAEAKALALYEGGALTREGAPATGTSTDAYAVACTGGGPRERYAGSVTATGYLVGRVVRHAVARALPAALQRLEALK